MFYAHLVIFKLAPEQRKAAEQLIKELDKMNRQLSGFRGNVYFMDDSSCEYRALNYWDTKKDAEQANLILFPILEKAVQKYTSNKPSYKMFEVFDPTNDSELISSHIL
ncbi:hypothetical protein [Peribacillus kribbensis]|uniref:hypothetical protein n=1 Tax=Peribacillus kribbensis TaxID=356658 RepID=UPI000402D380|nr:hypothetical protein [Peribacillus kribbensis]